MIPTAHLFDVIIPNTAGVVAIAVSTFVNMVLGALW